MSSSIIRPSGPLPPKVYWVRRLMLLAVLVAVVLLMWWFVASPDGGASDLQESAGSPSPAVAGPTEEASSTEDMPVPGTVATSPSDPPAITGESGRNNDRKPDTGGGHRADGGGGGSGGGGDDDDDKVGGTAENDAPREELPEPSGDCSLADVTLEIAVAKAAAEPGAGTTATLNFASTGEPACTLDITPDSLALRVTSGADAVWTSQDCPDSVLAQQLVVRSEDATPYQFDWDGRRSVLNCQGKGEVAAAGGYWIEAALVGSTIERSYFEIS
ncbi:MAG: hypothetical protein WKF73_16140 [Nocardioidaceae bacterium]